MNAELLYTSAPQGLKQGSRGFCTVLSTVGMPLNIATKLESLSGYRHLHPSGTPEAARNPVNHSHMKLTVGGRTLSVISRISDYGLDYSQRTNKLAHHIVVDSPMPTCGPAALLGDPSLMRSEWDGICLNIPTPPAIPSLTVEPTHCSLWESMTGDAGWAGVLANGWLNPTNKPIFIVFSEDQSTQLLALIAQAIALLPTAKRWQATFGTYVTNLPPDVDCKVRCVVAGSDEARMASARGLVIDLTRPCGPAPSSEAAAAARNGVLIGSQSNSQPSSVSADQSGSPQELERVATEEQESEKPGRLVEKPPTSELDPDRPFEAQVPGPPPTIGSGTWRIAPKLQQKELKHTSKNHPKLIALALLASVIAICSIVYFNYNINEFAIVARENVITPSKENHAATNSSDGATIERIEKKPETPSDQRKDNQGLLTDLPQAEMRSDEEIKTTPEPIPPKPFAQDKLRVDLSNLYLKYRTAKGEEIAVSLGITGATASASLKYEINDNLEQEKFEEWSKRADSIRWVWSQSVDEGRSWTPRLETESSTLVITSNDKPNTIFRVGAELKNSGEFNSQEGKILINTSAEVKTEDYVLIELDAQELARQSKIQNLRPEFRNIKNYSEKPNEYNIGLIQPTRSTRLKDFSLDDLKSQIASAGCSDGYMGPWEESRDSLKKTNLLREELKEYFLASKKDFDRLFEKIHFHESITNKVNRVIINGLQSLRESNSNSIEELRYFNRWDARGLVQWRDQGSVISKLTAKDFPSIHRDDMNHFNIEADKYNLNWNVKGLKDAPTNRDRLPSQVLEELVQSNSHFQNLRRDFLHSDFKLERPLRLAGLFLNRKDNNKDLSDDLITIEKAVCGLEFWYRIKIKGPAGEFINPVAVPPISQIPNLFPVQEQLQQPPK
jgi:hypothetical protein